jgi:GTP-binding protein HflX|tara:strand:- start:1612 stop:2937 length:1326 start_codon:yes stop_codon:yes gene_type:complete
LFFDRPEAGNNKTGDIAILVHIDFPEGDNREDPNEFKELVLSAGGVPVEFITGSRKAPDPKTFVGKGKVEEIKAMAEAHDADIILFNHALTPSQERNLEAALEFRVLDRTGLILDIFALRARTHEGKLQVELAQLQHQTTRLIRGWTHLERQQGGIGSRGAGESQLETDRRLVATRETLIRSKLKKVRAQREQGRRARKRSDIPTIALVGYTNAGKSTLFNALTNATVYAADQLFATLDPTLRRLKVMDVGEVVLADTVGFIRHLPHKLVEAFRATLQETTEANLLLHVIDSATDERDHNIQQVDNVLAEIEADKVPQLKVYNKIDLLEHAEARIDRDEHGVPVAVWLSAQAKIGFELLTQAISELVADDLFQETIQLTPADSRLRALLFEQAAVAEETYAENGDNLLRLRLQLDDFKKLLAKTGTRADRFIPVVLEDWQK